jgi:hypothetical membrane protein
MLIPAWFAIVYLATILLFIVLMYIASGDFSKRPFFRRTVSSLGEKGRLGNKIFNPILSFMGILNMLMAYFLYTNLPKNILTFLGAGFLFIGCIANIFIGVLYKGRKLHDTLAVIVFGGYLVSSLFLAYPLVISKMIPNWIMVIFDFFLLITVIFVIGSMKYKDPVWYDMPKKPLRKNFPFWQWIIFIAAFLWLAILFLILFLT